MTRNFGIKITGILKFWKDVIKAVVVLLLLTRTIDYLNQAQTPHASKLQLERQVPETGLYGNRVDVKSNISAFICSERELFKTVLDIRKRNCKLMNEGDTLKCLEIEECNRGRILMPRELPACAKRLPRCILIGVEKGGTHELLRLLMMNPMVIINMEFGRFLKNISGDQWTDQYRNEMPYSMADQITMEKGNYFPDPLVPGRIHEMDPDIKLLLMIRDPVARAISSLTFRTSVDEALAIFKRKGYNLSQIGDVHNSIYDEPFKRYLQYFKRSQIHVVDIERFKHDPFGVLKDVETFLGVPHAMQKSDFVFNDDKGFYCVRAIEQMHGVCFGDTRGRKESGNDPFEEYKSQLRLLFKPHNEIFFKLVGERFNWP